MRLYEGTRQRSAVTANTAWCWALNDEDARRYLEARLGGELNHLGGLTRYSKQSEPARVAECARFGRTITEAPHICLDCQGRGWCHMNEGSSNEDVQRCDSCAMYSDDNEAAHAHALECGCAWGTPTKLKSYI